MEAVESKQDKIRRLAREWYARNKNRIRERKLNQNHEYRRRLRVGRPPREVAKPERVLIFDMETNELKRPEPEPEPEPKPKPEVIPDSETKIEVGKYLVSFD